MRLVRRDGGSVFSERNSTTQLPASRSLRNVATAKPSRVHRATERAAAPQTASPLTIGDESGTASEGGGSSSSRSTSASSSALDSSSSSSSPLSPSSPSSREAGGASSETGPTSSTGSAALRGAPGSVGALGRAESSSPSGTRRAGPEARAASLSSRADRKSVG